MNKYFIKENYISRKKEIYFDDRENTDRFQNEVYLQAKKIFTRNEMSSVMDIGCGSAFKLLKYFKEFDTCGIDLTKTINFLKDKYPDRTWLDHNIKYKLEYQSDMIIASDIIEHLDDPDKLLNFIHGIEFKIAIISTPERDLVRGIDHQGPPNNIHHIREWNTDELFKYVSSKFKVINHELIQKNKQNTQFISFSKK
jgi:2-polyprenyl-3-methyl-5-hydroxy-6-metoxy-1,4-benzoquinol methylase